MAKLVKKGCCSHCGKKLAEGWGTLCDCEGSRMTGFGTSSYRKCAGGCGSTLPPNWKAPFCEDCHTRRLYESINEAEGVGGVSSGAALSVGDLPAPGAIITIKGQKYGIVNVKSMTDGPFPEVTITAKLLPKSAAAFIPAIPDDLESHDKYGRPLEELGVHLPTGVDLKPIKAAMERASRDRKEAAKLEKLRRRLEMERYLHEAETSGFGEVAAALRAALVKESLPPGLPMATPEHDAAWAAGPWVGPPTAPEQSTLDKIKAKLGL